MTLLTPLDIDTDEHRREEQYKYHLEQSERSRYKKYHKSEKIN